MVDFFILALAAFFAGMVDAVVGGGGLIQLPALFSLFPGTAPASLLGTSKLAGVWGTGAAAVAYARKVRVEWNTALPAAMSAFLFAFFGAYTVTRLPPDFLRSILPLLLLGHLLVQLGLMMAVCNIAGSVLGTRLALHYGSGWIRKLFLLVVCILLIKTGVDAIQA